MKKLLMAALALIGFTAATLAQTAPAVKKSEPASKQVAKKTTDKQDNGKVVATDKAVKPGKPASATAPAASKPTSATTPAAATNPAATAPLKKDGTPDKRYKANQGSTAGPVKKDGTPDMRYKANKKKG